MTSERPSSGRVEKRRQQIEIRRLAKEGIWRWEDFRLQLDDFELGFFQAAINQAKAGRGLSEVRIGPLRYAVGAEIVMLMEPTTSAEQGTKEAGTTR